MFDLACSFSSPAFQQEESKCKEIPRGSRVRVSGESRSWEQGPEGEQGSKTLGLPCKIRAYVLELGATLC